MVLESLAHGERQQCKSPPFNPSYSQHTQTATLHFTCPQDAFFGPNPQKHLLSFLEVPKLVTLGCSVELTRAWQHISQQHKEGAAEADVASKLFLFL